MNKGLAERLVLCDLDHLLLEENGGMPVLLRDVLHLFVGRGGRLTVFSQRSPQAVRSLLGGVRLAAPALVCGGTLACSLAEDSMQPLCSFAGVEASVFHKLLSVSGSGVALQMADGQTRVLRMTETLEKHLRDERTPFILCNPADIAGKNVLRILVYLSPKQPPLRSALEAALGETAETLLAERIAPDTLALTPGAISGAAMFNVVCPPVGCSAGELTVLANCTQMRELLALAGQSTVPADASPELRALAAQTTLTDRSSGAAAEYLYHLVRTAECAG